MFNGLVPKASPLLVDGNTYGNTIQKLRDETPFSDYPCMRYVCFCEATMLFHTTTTLFSVVIFLSALVTMFFFCVLDKTTMFFSVSPQCSFPW